MWGVGVCGGVGGVWGVCVCGCVWLWVCGVVYAKLLSAIISIIKHVWVSRKTKTKNIFHKYFHFFSVRNE